MPAKKSAKKSSTKSKGYSTGNSVSFQQILIAPFTSSTGSSYSVLGLSKAGRVYRYDPKCEGWIPWSNTIASCKNKHPAKR